MSEHTESAAKPTPGPWHAFTPFGKSWSDHGYRMIAFQEFAEAVGEDFRFEE